jgi:hypothetical protein
VTTWTFIYMMVILKIPIALLLYIVWWAIHQTPEEWTEQSSDGDGGSRRPRHPRGRRPRGPRRGPQHAVPVPASPPRVRAVVARGRRVRPR